MSKGFSHWGMQHIAAITLCASAFITVAALASVPRESTCGGDKPACHRETKPVKPVSDRARAKLWGRTA